MLPKKPGDMNMKASERTSFRMMSEKERMFVLAEEQGSTFKLLTAAIIGTRAVAEITGKSAAPASDRPPRDTDPGIPRSPAKIKKAVRR
jgi:hypothetical protein